VTDLTVDFNEPYSGGVFAGVVPLPPDRVGIDTRTYVLDTEGDTYRREGVEVLQQRNTTSNRDLLLLPQNVWRHQDESWHLGAGQRNRDREDALTGRFYRSFGMDPWTKYQLSLLNETSKLKALAVPEACYLQVHAGHLYAIVDDGVFSWATPASPEVFLQLPAGSGKTISVTYDGDAVIILTDAGKVFEVTNPTTVTQRTVTPPAGGNPVTGATFVAYVKGYLLLGVGNQLWNITAPQAVLVYTSPVVGFTWVGAAEGTNAIYLAGGSGDKHVIHRVSVKDDGTGLDPAIVAATLPDGENAVSIGAYLGYVFVGSGKGVRMATPNNSAGDLTLGALIPTAAPVYGFEGQGQYVWGTLSTMDPVTDSGPVAGCPTAPMSGLFRADLTSFTVTESTPAYANDLYAVDLAHGVSRSVTTWNDVRAFAVDGHGIYVETTTRVPAGWVASGRVSYSVEDTKTGLYAQGKWEPLHGRVAIDLSYDSQPHVRVFNWAIQGSISSGNIPLNGAQFSRVDPIIALYRDDTDPTRTPVFTRFEVRARPAKGQASRWYLPILNHQTLDINGIMETRNVNTEFDRLLTLVQTGRMFALQEGGHVYQCVGVDYKWFPQKLTEHGDGWQGIFVVICEEVR
jgi:hypothetical protein